ncbi:MAG: hypothetical protein QOJ84_1585 [Bradyrhizobium sp.]|jgi:hypothetical protein|nr:hypothetical protein [Bradyrhizobium sp.]
MGADFPELLEDWEVALTRHFLMIRGEDSGALRAFDISGATLAAAFASDAPDAATLATAAFKNALCADKERLFAALERGRFARNANDKVFGCFSYLALTLLVDSQYEIGDGGSEFRPKLSSFLGVTRGFSQLVGVNAMWVELRDWLNEKSAAGEPYRELVLPDEGSWNHIGYSVRLSFPSRTDRSFLSRFFDDNPGILADEPRMLEKLRNLVLGSRASPGLKAAFEEFHRAYSGDRRSLADHRFWQFVRAVASSRSLVAATEADLEIFPDEDGLRSFSVTQSGSADEAAVHPNLGAAVEDILALGLTNLRRSVERGFLIFKRAGHARWLAAGSLAECHGFVHLGCTPSVAAAAAPKLGPLEQSGSWFISAEAVPVGRAEEALQRFLGKERGGSPITTVRIEGGVRTGHHWLGRPSLLPRVIADAGDLALTKSGRDGGTSDVLCEETEDRPGCYAIKSRRPLDGAFTLRPANRSDGSSWSHKLRFVRNALLHETERKLPAGGSCEEWSDNVALSVTSASPELRWQRLPQALDDTIEAVYAGGRAGWNENAIIPLLREVLPARANPWDFLRSLQEATMLKPFFRHGHKGRTWSLGEARLVPIQGPDVAITIADGCMSSVMADDFRSVVTSLGGVPFRSTGISDWTLPIVGAVGVDVTVLATRLNRSVAEAKRPGGRTAAFVETLHEHKDYQHASSWCWEKGRFVTGAVERHSNVELTRWIHRGGRDHDVYVVLTDRRERRFLSRTSAIAVAHIAARRSLFKNEGGLLQRVAREGFLPDGIAGWLRYSNLANSTALGDGRYAYPVRMENRTKIAAGLREAVDFAEGGGDTLSSILSVRRSGGADRLMWSNGRLVSSSSLRATSTGAGS